MVGSRTWLTKFTIFPNLAITFGASFVGIWIICETSKLKGNPSLLLTVIVDKFLSKLWDSLLAVAQFKTKLVVGTNSTFIMYGFTGYLPGPRGSAQTPLKPLSTIFPCLNSLPLKSFPSSPT